MGKMEIFIGVILAGRHLLWLLIGIAGFLGGFNAAISLLPGYSKSFISLIAGACGVLGITVALLFKKAALMFFGVIGSGIFAVTLWTVAYPQQSWQAKAGVFAAGAALGVILAMSAFVWTLIFISSFCGATIVVKNIPLSPTAGFVGFLILTVGGILFQYWRLIEEYSKESRKRFIYDFQKEKASREKNRW